MEDFSCLNCAGEACEFATGGNPVNCTEHGIDEATARSVRERYLEGENHAVMKCAMQTSAKCGGLTRVQELMEFAHLMGAKRIGIATCTMLIRESRTLARLLEEAGFEVAGVACKVQGNRRRDLDLVLEDGEEGPVLCNPIMQAELLRQAECDLNVVMGLCVGHDALFNKYSHTLTTTLVAKDHITGHNPCAALWASKSVYKKRLQETIESCRKKD